MSAAVLDVVLDVDVDATPACEVTAWHSHELPAATHRRRMYAPCCERVDSRLVCTPCAARSCQEWDLVLSAFQLGVPIWCRWCHALMCPRADGMVLTSLGGGS